MRDGGSGTGDRLQGCDKKIINNGTTAINSAAAPGAVSAVLATMETKFALMAGQLCAIPCNWGLGILKCPPDQMASHNCKRIFKKSAPHQSSTATCHYAARSKRPCQASPKKTKKRTTFQIKILGQSFVPHLPYLLLFLQIRQILSIFYQQYFQLRYLKVLLLYTEQLAQLE